MPGLRIKHAETRTTVREIQHRQVMIALAHALIDDLVRRARQLDHIAKRSETGSRQRNGFQFCWLHGSNSFRRCSARTSAASQAAVKDLSSSDFTSSTP